MKIQNETEAGTTFVLPLATIIETGNHISQATHSRRERGTVLADLMRKSADQQTPWAAFSDQSFPLVMQPLRMWPIITLRWDIPSKF